MRICDYSIDMIEAEGKVRGIITFGAGSILKHFFTKYPSIAQYVMCVIDNDQNKIGNEYVFEGKSFPIVGLGYVTKFKEQRPLIVITNTHEYDVFNQMNMLKDFNSWECCVHFLVYEKEKEKAEKRREYHTNYKSKKGDKIPRKIHYCWFGKGELPEKAKLYLESWKEYCPDYEIIRWDENNYNVNNRDYTRQAYEKGEWAFVSDVARLDIIYNEGGVYLDTDVEIIRSFDSLLSEDCFFGLEDDTYVNTGLGFGAKARSSIIDGLRKLYDGREFILEDGSEDRMSCPIFQQPYFVELGYDGSGNYYRGEGFVIYPRSVFSPKSFVTGRTHITDNTFSIHHFDMSWHNDDEKERVWNRYKLAEMAGN